MKKFVSKILIMALALSMVAGCSNETDAPTSGADNGDAPATTSTPDDGGEIPVVEYWVELNVNVSATSSSMNETPLTAELEERLGIDIEYIHPTQGQTREEFNLLIAGADLPDVIEAQWLNFYPGGPELAFQNQLLEPMNDVMAEKAPNFTALVQSDPEIAKMVSTDAGNYYGFTFLRGAEELKVFVGPYLREDWLEDVDMEVPTTINDWYNVLTAFKNEKGATAPLTHINNNLNIFERGFLSGAYGVTTDLFIDADGNVTYGPAQPEFKEFLIEMNKWYSEGLIDQDFYLNDRAAAEEELLNNNAGGTIGLAASGLGTFQTALDKIGEGGQYVGAPYPTLEEGDRAMFGQQDFAFMKNYVVAVVPKNADNKDAAYKLLDYGYSEEGGMLYNFGIEGESYEMIDNYPTYTEMITNNADGKTMPQMMAQYTRANYNGPFVQQLPYYYQYMGELQQESIAKWKETDVAKYQLPAVTPTDEESAEYNQIKLAMDTWRDEWVVSAIRGEVSIDDFETDFVAELENIGLARAIEIQQAALARYNAR